MTIQILQLTDCPYCCGDEGDVFLDARELSEYVNHGGDVNLYEQPEQTLLLFNSRSTEHVPCPHLLGIVGDCDLGVKQEGRWTQCDASISFCWWHELTFPQDRLLIDVMFNQVLHQHTPRELKGNIPVLEERFVHTWPARNESRDGHVYEAAGILYFAPDIEGLFHSAPDLVAAYND